MAVESLRTAWDVSEDPGIAGLTETIVPQYLQGINCYKSTLSAQHSHRQTVLVVQCLV